MKRTQEASEDEPIVGGPAAVNGIGSEILYLLDPAQGLSMPEGNNLFRVTGDRFEETRSRRSIRTTHSLLLEQLDIYENNG